MAGRPRALPNARAVLGGILVAVASLATYAQWVATDSPRHRYVVAARPIAPGRAIAAADLVTAAVDLPPAVRAGAFTDVRRLVGARVVAPLRAGELVQAGSVTAGGTAPAEISFGIEAARALDGAVGVGDRVDLVATYGQDTSAWSAVVARDVLVTGVGSGGPGAPSGSTIVVTVGLEDEALVLPVTHAARTGVLTIVRIGSAGAGTGDEGGGVYRPAAPATS